MCLPYAGLVALLLTVLRLHITFIDKDGDEHTFEVAKGDNLLDIALEHDIEMEGNDLLSGPLTCSRLLTLGRSLRRIMCLFDMPCDCRRGRDV